MKDVGEKPIGGDEMFKLEPVIGGAEQEKCRMSDISDWGSSVTSTADIQCSQMPRRTRPWTTRAFVRKKDAAPGSTQAFGYLPPLPQRMCREMERDDSERQRQEERLTHEQLREEEKLQREQKRQLKIKERFMQKENLRAEKMRLKQAQHREKEAAKRKAACETTARRIAGKSMTPIEDERLELMELAASSKGLSSIKSLDSDTLENMHLFRDMLVTYPPKSVQLSRPFTVQPWRDSEENVGNLLMAWRFLISFVDVLELLPFTLDEFVQAFHDYDPRLLGEIHVALLRYIVKDIEDAPRTPSMGLGAKENSSANPGGGHPHIVQGAYDWGFDIRSWQQHLNPLTWPEVLRQFALSAGFGPRLKKRSLEQSRGDNEGHDCDDIVSTLRNGAEGVSAAAGMQEKGLSEPHRSRHRLTQGTLKFAAFHVLSLEGSKGLSVQEVAVKIQKYGLQDLRTYKKPEASVAAALSRDPHLFERTARSTYCVRAAFRKDQEEDHHPAVEIDESNSGEPWVQGLMEEYADLPVEDRLNALVALIGVVIEGNLVRAILEERSEEMYAYRYLPLGQDRKRNRYWQFVTSATRSDPGTGRIFYESQGGCWRLIDSEEAFNILLSSLDIRGIRESHLLSMLQKVEVSFKDAVRRNSKCKNHVGSSEDQVKTELPDRSAQTESPSSTVCALGYDKVIQSSSFKIDLGSNETEKTAALERYQDLQRWMWKECFDSSTMCAIMYGKKRCSELLVTCNFCFNSYTSEDNRCPVGHSNFLGPETSLPIRIELLKAQLAVTEVSVPPEAIQHLWTEDVRNSWGLKLQSSSSAKDLLQVLTLLEGAIKRDCLSSSFETTKELLGNFAPSVHAADGLSSGSVPVLPWVPETTAAVALRLLELDASITYMSQQKKFPAITPEPVVFLQEENWFDVGSDL